MTTIERDGLPVSVGRTRRTGPPTLRRLLDARDEGTCCWPGCENRRHLDAHHRVHWAHGGDTSLANLVLLCWHHHRLVHEGGYSIEDDPAGGLRFRNRYGVVCPGIPPRSPPGSVDELMAQHTRLGLAIDETTSRSGCGPAGARSRGRRDPARDSRVTGLALGRRALDASPHGAQRSRLPSSACEGRSQPVIL